MRPIRQRERALICASGSILCAFACATVPRNAVAVAFPDQTPRAGLVASLAEPPPGRIAIVRDPFVADARAERRTEPNDPPSFAPIPGIPVLPPNRAALGAVPGAPDAPVTVRAIVTGTHPCALVDLAGAMILVRPGDRLLGRRVESIDLAGIVVTGGLRLALDSEGVPR